MKASVLHEFGGDRSFHLAVPDGETMDLTNHYGSTYRVNNSTYLYVDAERSFGSDWHKKWQANVGSNWQF
ncbi:autotransporter outer membrane beta-barrel domain-containing protein [Megasphaera sp.]|uniref:autotransporter outer membrane beta-barrel domain-containing protein n=1 Tax=Megasphaera sp. TaxID=2023260 RepID=UPI003520F248